MDKKSGKQSEPEAKPESWWENHLSRRDANRRIAAFVAMAGIAGGSAIAISQCDSETEIQADALELQKTQGWNIGAYDDMLQFNAKTQQDSRASRAWSSFLDPMQLMKAYEPKQAWHRSFVVPTLVQSLSQQSLKSRMAPVFTNSMREAYSAGLGMREILQESRQNANTAIVADLQGDDSVAFGAALADMADLVMVFDNWPHSYGVVPSHQTLAALLYYAEEVRAKAVQRPDTAPALFLLDNRRIAPVVEDELFDNRYVAKLPSAENFAKFGIKNILYVTPDAKYTQEMDDLNADFTAYEERGIHVSMLPLSNFMPSKLVKKDSAIINSQTGAAEVVPEAQPAQVYHYGGSPGGFMWFYYHYPVFDPVRPVPPVGRMAPSAYVRSPYRPVPRTTLFSSRAVGGAAGVGKQRPSGFGVISAASRNGRSPSVSAGRYGSYGRMSGGYSS